MKLSTEEEKTLNSYSIIAKVRNNTHANPNFWQREFDFFKQRIRSGKVLDVGCGAGRDSLLLSNSYEYVGIDACPEMLDAARVLNPKAYFREMNMYSLSFPNEYFDCFWAAASLLHIPKCNLESVLSEIKRVTKLAGLGFIAVKEGEGEKLLKQSEHDERFFAFYKQKEFENKLKDSGFIVLEKAKSLIEYSPPKNLTVWLTYFVAC